MLDSGILEIGLGFCGFWFFSCVCILGRGSVVLGGIRGLVARRFFAKAKELVVGKLRYVVF